MLTLLAKTTTRTRLPLLAAALALAAAAAIALLPGLGLTPPPPPAEAAHVTVSSISITSTSTGGSYYNGDAITVQVVFSHCINSTSGAYVSIGIGNNTRNTGNPASHGSNTLTFSYTVTAQDNDADGITIATGALNGTYNARAQSGCSSTGAHNTLAPTLPNTYASAQFDHRVNVNFLDHDQDNDGLIEIRGTGAVALRRLLAIQADPDGNGIPQESIFYPGSEISRYNTAFTNRQSVATATAGIMGCSTPEGAARACIGYELSHDITFDLNDDGQVTSAAMPTGDGHSYFGNGFRPLGLGTTSAHWFRTTFDGNGYTISYARPSAPQSDIALFSQATSGAHIRNLGLDNYYMSNNRGNAEQGALVGWMEAGATVSNCWAAGTVTNSQAGPGGVGGSTNKIGGLVGQLNGGTIRNSWANVAASSHTGNFNVLTGGLVGHMVSGLIQGSYAAGAVAGGGGNAGSDRAGVGGLVGHQAGGTITASYATGAVTGSAGAVVGGLVSIQTGGTITASYATGAVATSANGFAAGLVANPTVTRVGGGLVPGSGTITNSYWDTETTGIAADAASNRGAGRATAALQSPTDYTGIYRNWNVNVDADSLRDDPWHFGTSSQYPVLKFARTLDQVYDQIPGVAAPTTPVDYDTGVANDLIEISTIAQLNAVRFDLDGSGADGLTSGRHGLVPGTQAHTYYHLAFPGAADATAGIGCASGAGMCDGYELAADLDFANTGWALSNGWVPIGVGAGADANATSYGAVFHGQGHTINGLTIDSVNVFNQGLFGRLYRARVEQVGLLNASLTASNTGHRWISAGLLAGASHESIIRSSYAVGQVDATVTGNQSALIQVGGLVGVLGAGSAGNASQIAASWADVALNTTSTGTNAVHPDQAGGLVGDVAGAAANGAAIIASYATGAVSMDGSARAGTRCAAGGLVGRAGISSIIASYSSGAPTCDPGAGGSSAVGGLIGLTNPANAAGHTHANSYWDTQRSGQTTSQGGSAIVGKTTAELQAGLAATYAGDFAMWNVNVDGDTGTGTPTVGGDDPWDFGTASQYPILKYGYNDFGQQMQRTSDHDSDGDGLLQVDSLAKLDAVRYDPSGAGDSTAMAPAGRAAYRAAFPNHARCAPNPCTGYELTADLDFDENGDGTVDATDWAGAYWNDGAGWTPIGPGGAGPAYTGRFHGNSHTIANMLIDATDVTNVGLFGWANGGPIENVGLTDVDITANYPSGSSPGRAYAVGALAGTLTGTVRSSYAAGLITVDVTDTSAQSHSRVGGLVGQTFLTAAITASYAQTAIALTSTSADPQPDAVGGLLGSLFGNATNPGAITASYATGAVSANRDESRVGGLLGETGQVDITASYATGAPTATGSNPVIGGLIANLGASATITASYWDQDTSGITMTGNGDPHTTTALQTPAGYTGIYADWNVDVDGDAMTGDAAGNDDPWHFGTGSQYPILKFGHNAVSYAYQLGLENVDYDTDDDNLIDVTNLHQLHAIRYDADGNGVVAAGAAADGYALGYPAALANMGCPDPVNGCIGYELLNDLDFDTAGNDRVADSPYANWTPLPAYSGTFDGKGHRIANLNINIASSPAGLFSSLNGADGVIRSLGLINPTINVQGGGNVGALVGENNGGASIYAVYVSGGSVTATAGQAVVGGLAGRNTGSSIVASYAISAPVVVSGSGTFFRAGGLVGGNYSGATIRASWAASLVTNTGSSFATTSGGLVGYTAGTIDYSYHDGGVEATDNTGGTSQTNALLVGTDGYTGIYQDWNVDVDGDAATGDAAGNDDPWDFGGPLQYPLLTYGRSDAEIARQRANLTFTDYDLDDDNLIEVDSLAKLNAIRYDLDGQGDRDTVTEQLWVNYTSVFPRPLAAMGCPAGCTGYELTTDLDFDTGTAGDRTDDDYYNGGLGWARIGACCAGGYNAIFDGNGHTIANLFINRPSAPADYGLFGGTGPNGHITKLGLPNANVTGQDYVGALAGDTRGRVSFCWATGSVSGNIVVGMLVGINHGPILSSWSHGQVSASSRYAGGLAGASDGNLIATYSHAAVTTSQTAGSLTGQIQNATDRAAGNTLIDASYGVGTVSGGTSEFAGLAFVLQFPTNQNANAADITNSYWDTATTGITGGRATADLQGTSGYTDLYANWNVDVDNADADNDHTTNGATGEDSGGDNPWDFAAPYQYPILRFGHSAASIAAQLNPQDPTLTRIPQPANVDRLRQTGPYAYLMEVDSPVETVALPPASFTTTQTDATVAAPTTDTTGASVGGDDGDVVTLGPGETPTLVTIRVTSPNGRSTLDYILTIQRIFCPKASLTGPSDVVGEGGTAEFTVLVCGQSTADVVVTWDAAGGSAQAGDLGNAANTAPLTAFPTGQSITVPAGNDRTATIRIPIFDDDTPEGSESFTVTLTGVSGGTERYDDNAPETATIALSDPSITLRAPDGMDGTGAGAGDGADTPLTASSRLIITEGAANAYTMQLAGEPLGPVTIVIHSNHDGITTTPDRVTFTPGNWQDPQRVTVNAAQDGDDNNESATLTHILTDADGGLIEIIDQLPLFVADTDPPEDDDIC